jgi:alpha-L-rhamnosidase
MDIYAFKKAQAVWAKGMQTEMNMHLGFAAKIYAKKASVAIAASSVYQLFVNGNFVCYGPARCAHGFHRVDETDISSYLTKGANTVAVIVCGYNINSYSLPDQPAFLTCEVTDEDTVLAATGDNGFDCMIMDDYVRRVQRYTYQRDFVEVYNLHQDTYGWMKDKVASPVEIGICDKKTYLKRGVPYPGYEDMYPNSKAVKGTHTPIIPESYRRPWQMNVNKPYYKEFPEATLEAHISEEMQRIKYDMEHTQKTDITSGTDINKGEYLLCEFEREATGMVKFHVSCAEPSTFMMIYDETLKDGVVNPLRMACVWVNKYTLAPGVYDLIFFEPVSMKYLNTVVTEGMIRIGDLHIMEYKFHEVDRSLDTDNEDYIKIYNAAVETFRQNTLDIYMDCPSRERAGWLCDSFFTSRVEYFLTGRSVVERNFLENFLIRDTYPDIVKGVFPECYPADHPSGQFIPNWAMWLVLELYEYRTRSKDEQMIAAFKDKVYGLIDYFKPFLNKDGMLQDLEHWIFVEWSEANKLVQNVNFPTNMLYALMLEKTGDMYNDRDLIRQAEDMRKKIRELSFTGEFFCDNLVKTDSDLVRSNKCTEACQYYAFFTKTATKELYPELWEILMTKFGPDRAKNGYYPEIYPANAFIGNYLRLELLSDDGRYKQLLDESVGFFLYMADRTGTLWENITDSASLNHGFASHAAVWLDKAVKQLKTGK